MRFDRNCSAQILNVVRCYPPQPEDGEYPERDFVKVLEESGSAAPTTSRASTRHANVDRVEDSEDLGPRSPLSGDDDGAENYLALEEENQRLTAQLEDVRRK
jgi:hypothetical protein